MDADEQEILAYVNSLDIAMKKEQESSAFIKELVK